MSDYVALTNLPPKSIGDALIYSSLPENYYLNIGVELIDWQKHYIFDYNPFVLRDVKIEKGDTLKMLDIRGVIDPCVNRMSPEEKNFLSFQEIFGRILGLKIYRRGPRLYYLENAIQKKRICIHTIGISQQHQIKNGQIPKKIIDFVIDNYKGDYEVLQIGSKNDPLFDGLKDARSDNFWFTVSLIAQSECFIGMSSGPLHIANAYDNVKKKVIIFNNEQELQKWRPCSWCNVPGSEWIDFGLDYYNIFDYDIGATKSYRRL